jgi:hypothetical protein
MILASFVQKPEVLHQSSINGSNPTNYFSFGLDLHQGACSKFLSRLVHLFRYCGRGLYFFILKNFLFVNFWGLYSKRGGGSGV